MLEMPFTVVFIVSSSVQSIPNAVRAKGQTSPPNCPYSNRNSNNETAAPTVFQLHGKATLLIGVRQGAHHPSLCLALIGG